MSVEEYFSTIMMVLMGLTFIALALIFLYMVYGEKEEAPSVETKATTATNFALSWANRILFYL
jgi:hypothetical protein